MIHQKAYAKINLALDVLKRLPNGYHEIRTVLQQIGLYDDVWVGKSSECGKGDGAAEEGIYLTVEPPVLPTGKQNLAWRAAKLFKDTYGIQEDITIHIEKRIPMGAGLAGGSADAAAVLLAMRELFDKGLSLQELSQMGAWVGADVPFCIMGGAAQAEGIGEKLTPVRSLSSKCVIVLCKPDFSISTKETYEAYSSRLEELKKEKHPNIDALRERLEEGQLPSADWQAYMVNVLEYISATIHPQIRQVKEALSGFGADAVLMSGSGPAVYGLFSDGEKAVQAYEKMEKIYPKTYVVRPQEGQE